MGLPVQWLEQWHLHCPVPQECCSPGSGSQQRQVLPRVVGLMETASGGHENYPEHEKQRDYGTSFHCGKQKSGNRVESTRMKRMTPANTLDRKQTPSPRSVALECFKRILRTRGIVPACCGEEWTEEQLVAPHDAGQENTHHSRVVDTRSIRSITR